MIPPEKPINPDRVLPTVALALLCSATHRQAELPPTPPPAGESLPVLYAAALAELARLRHRHRNTAEELAAAGQRIVELSRHLAAASRASEGWFRSTVAWGNKAGRALATLATVRRERDQARAELAKLRAELAAAATSWTCLGCRQQVPVVDGHAAAHQHHHQGEPLPGWTSPECPLSGAAVQILSTIPLPSGPVQIAAIRKGARP